MSLWKSTVNGYEPHVITERQNILQTAMDELPDDLEQVLLIRYYDDAKPKEIAAANGTSTQVVRNAMRRGLRRLRKTLKENGIDDLGSI